MNRKDRKHGRHPVSLRVLALTLAMALLFTSSGFQIIAEEAQATES